MLVGNASYDCVVSFLSGYDHALNGSLLVGFHEWLTMKLGYGHNLGWSALLVDTVLGDAPIKAISRTEDEDALLLERLRQVLTEYLRLREEIGLRNVLFDHGTWLREQEWFDENV